MASQPRAEPDVDEPLTQYSAALYVGRARGAEAQVEALDQQIAANYQAMPMLGLADGPAARETQAFESAGEYAGLVYGKAPFFFAALSARYSPGRSTRAWRATPAITGSGWQCGATWSGRWRRRASGPAAS